MKLCECGCGQNVNDNRRFITGHNARVDNPMHKPDIVEKFKGNKNPAKRPENRKKISEGLMGRIVTQSHREKQSESMKKWHNDLKNNKKIKEMHKKQSRAITGRNKNNHKGRMIQSKKLKQWWREPKNFKKIKEMVKKRTEKIKGQRLNKTIEEIGHKPGCPCPWCKAKRGEFRGDNNPMKIPEIKQKSVSHHIDWDFYNRYNCLKSRYPYHDLFNNKFKDMIRARDNYRCAVTGISQESHIKKYKSKLCVHHWTYNKNETNPFYFVTVSRSINGMANNIQNRLQWIDMFNGIMEEKYCEMIK